MRWAALAMREHPRGRPRPGPPPELFAACPDSTGALGPKIYRPRAAGQNMGLDAWYRAGRGRWGRPVPGHRLVGCDAKPSPLSPRFDCAKNVVGRAPQTHRSAASFLPSMRVRRRPSSCPRPTELTRPFCPPTTHITGTTSIGARPNGRPEGLIKRKRPWWQETRLPIPSKPAAILS